MVSREKLLLICQNCFQHSKLVLPRSIINGSLARVAMEPNHAVIASCTNCGSEMFQVDYEIGEPILELNKMGFTTYCSCQGHFRHEIIRDEGGILRKTASWPYLMIRPEIGRMRTIQIVSSYERIMTLFADFYKGIKLYLDYWDFEHNCTKERVETDSLLQAAFELGGKVEILIECHDWDRYERAKSDQQRSYIAKQATAKFSLFLETLVVMLRDCKTPAQEGAIV